MTSRRRAASRTASPASHARDITTDTIVRALNRGYVSPVLTAHPTEVQRKSTLDAERAIADLLAERDTLRSSRERADNEAQLRSRVVQLWQTRVLRTEKLTVRDEIENALSYYASTFLTEIPAHLRRPRGSSSGGPWRRFFRMGNWIGGDRDGNPNVDADDPRHRGDDATPRSRCATT